MSSNVTTIRDSKGQFVPGVSGNPAGKNQYALTTSDGKSVRARDLFLKDVPEVHTVLLDIIRNINPKKPTAPQVRAVTDFLDRGLGKAAQSVAVSNEKREEPTLDVASLSTEAKREILAAAKKVANDRLS